MANIPTDIITDFILPNLPAKSLVRFKCVSKSFNTLISSPEFIDDHLRRSKSSNANRLLILTIKDTSNLLHSIDVESSSYPSTIQNIPLPLPESPDDGQRLSIVQACSLNGLLCVGKVFKNMYGAMKINHVLINPCTGEYRPIPYCDIDHYPKRVSFGFWYDDLNDDYKLVTILESARYYYRPYFKAHHGYVGRKVMIYSLNKDEWKSVQDIDTQGLNLSYNSKGVLINNHLLHWVFYGLETFHICCFDVRSEEWVDNVPLMDMFTYPLTDDDLRLENLDVLDDCLSLWTRTSSLVNNRPGYSIAVWIMKEYGVQESWIKLFEISCGSPMCSSPFYVPFGFRNGSRREFLLRDPNKIQSPLYWYDIDLKTFDMSEIEGVTCFEDACFVKGSLVKIPGGRPIQEHMNKI